MGSLMPRTTLPSARGLAQDCSRFYDWRVDRIRDSEVVFSRGDPTRTDRPAETRTLALHTGKTARDSFEMDD